MVEEPPDNERLYVPLHEAACGVSLRLFRDRGGARCAVGFTNEERLTSVLGENEPFYRLTERAVRDLAAERGVYELVVDPGMVAAPVHEPVTVPDTMPTAAPTALPVPVLSPVPVHVPALARIKSSRAAWSPEAAGVLVISAIGGAAALLMQVL